MSGRQFQLNVHKTTGETKGNVALSRAQSPIMDRGDTSIYQQVRLSHYNKYQLLN